jgi:hypothetical protein
MVEIQCDTCKSHFERYIVTGHSEQRGCLVVDVCGCSKCTCYLHDEGCAYYEKKPQKIYVGIYDQRGYRQIGYITSFTEDGCDTVALVALNDVGIKELQERW